MDFIKRNAGIIATIALIVAVVAIFSIKNGKDGSNGQNGKDGTTLGDASGSTSFNFLALGDGPEISRYEITPKTGICNDATTTLAVIPNPYTTTATVRYAELESRNPATGVSTLPVASSIKLYVGTSTNTSASTTIASRTNLISGVPLGGKSYEYTIPFINNHFKVATSSAAGSPGNALNQLVSGGGYYLASSTVMVNAPLGITTGASANGETTEFDRSLWGSTSPQIIVKPGENLVFAVEAVRTGTVSNPLGDVVDSSNTFACQYKAVFER